MSTPHLFRSELYDSRVSSSSSSMVVERGSFGVEEGKGTRNDLNCPAYVRVMGILELGAMSGRIDAVDFDVDAVYSSYLDGEGRFGREGVRSNVVSWSDDWPSTDDSVFERESIRLASFEGEVDSYSNETMSSKIRERSRAGLEGDC